MNILIDINVLHDYLKNRRDVSVSRFRAAKKTELSCCLFPEPDIGTFEEALYVCSISQLSMLPKNGVTSALFICDGNPIPDTLEYYAANYLLVETDTDDTAVFSAVDQFFMEIERLRTLKKSILAATAHLGTCQELLDKISELLECPCALMRAPAEQMAAAGAPYVFPAFTPKQEQILSALAADITAEQQPEFRYFDPSGSMLFAAESVLRARGLYVLFSNQHQDSVLAEERLRIAVQGISIFMDKSYDQAIEKGDMNARFKSILEGRPDQADGYSALNRTDNSGLTHFVIAVAQWSRYTENTGENLFQYYGKLAKLCKASAYANVGRQKRFAMLLCRSSATLFTDEEMEAINLYCTEQQIFICCSSPFVDLQDGRDYFLQAKAGLELSLQQGSKPSCRSCEATGASLLFGEAASSNSLAYFCAPEILELHTWDKVSGDSLSATLRAYICNAQNKSATAAELNISRAALQQRLDKMESVLQKPLNSYHTLMDLYSSLRCLEHS